MDDESRQDDAPGPARERPRRAIWWVAGAIVALLVATRFAPEVRESFLPEPRAAYVALAAEGDPAASDGGHRLAAGRPFRLYAVLEAETLAGDTVWFTDAPALRLAGRDIPRAALRPWPAERPARVRWLTIEGFAPYLAVERREDLERFRLNENYHPEWGAGWVAEGRVAPRQALLEPDSPLAPLAFGHQRWAVRVELFAGADARTPSGRWSSPGVEAVRESPRRGTWLTAELAPPLDVVSRAAGLVAVDPASGLAGAAAADADALVEAGFAFEARRLIAAHLEASGRTAAGLEFRTVSLGPEGPAWGTEALPGDLLRAGDRVVLLLADFGTPGRLDPADQVVDLERGFHVGRVDRAFRAENGLRLDLAAVAPRASEPGGR